MEAVGELRALIDSDLSSSAAVAAGAGAMGAMVLRVLQAVAELIREPMAPAQRRTGLRAAGAGGVAFPGQGSGQEAAARGSSAGAPGPADGPSRPGSSTVGGAGTVGFPCGCSVHSLCGLRVGFRPVPVSVWLRVPC